MQRTYQLSEFGPTRADSALRALLVREGRRRHFPAGSMIVQQGDQGAGFWLIEAGKVLVVRFSMDGGLTVYGVLGAGDLFGELAHFANVPRQVDVLAESAATLVQITPQLVDRLLEQEPEFARLLLKSLANQLRNTLDRIDGDRHLSAEARLARVLHDMVRREGPELAITQQGLADLIGVSRVTVGQVLGRFEQAELLALGYRRMTILDPVALAARAEGG